MVDDGATSGRKSPRPRPLSRKCRTGNRDTGWLPPKPTVAPLQWLQKPELPLSAEERKLAPPRPETPINGKVVHRAAIPLPSVTDPSPIPPKSNGHARDLDRRAIAAKEQAERDAEHDAAVVAAGRSAWTRLRKDTARLHDHKLIGDALLVGRRLCMQAVGATKPRGLKYVKANSAWLNQHGFDEIPHSTRQCSMLISENWTPLQGWMKTLSPARRYGLNHPVSTWRAYRTRDRDPVGKVKDPGWRGRKTIDMTRARAAIAAVRCEAPELPADVARNVAFAVMRALGVAVPRELMSRPVAVAECVELQAVG